MVSAGSAAQSSPCEYRPPVASVPDSFPTMSYGPRRGSDPDLPLGIGHLGWTNGSAEWYRHLVMPVFGEPGASPNAWFVRGWLVRSDNGVEPFDFNGLVETGYEIPSAIVFERRDDGWMRLRFSDDESGHAWAHECAFSQDSTTLAFESWADRFGSGNTSALFFRRPVRHALREGPNAAARLLHWIPADSDDYHLEVIETRDEWMRVRVVQPSDNCRSPEDAQSVRTEGWIRWYDQEVGPWLWYHTRGC